MFERKSPTILSQEEIVAELRDALDSSQNFVTQLEWFTKQCNYAFQKKEHLVEEFILGLRYGVTTDDIEYFILSVEKEYVEIFERMFLFDLSSEFLRTLLLRAIQLYKDFNIEPYKNFLSKFQFIFNPIRIVIDYDRIEKSFTYRIELNEEFFNKAESYYGDAVIATREELGLGALKNDPMRAYFAWKKYYEAAREGRRIYKTVREKGQKKIVEVTQEYAAKYWRTIKTRIKYLPKKNFFSIYPLLDLGNEVVSLKSDIGAPPYPVCQGLNLTNFIRDYVDKLMERELRRFINEMIDQYVIVDFYIEDDLKDLEINLDRLVETLDEKGVISQELHEEILENIRRGDTEDAEAALKRGIATSMRNLGLENVRTEFYKTSKGNVRMSVRDKATGRFKSWRKR